MKKQNNTNQDEIKFWRDRANTMEGMIAQQELRSLSHEEKITKLEKELVQKDARFIKYICEVLDLARKSP